MKTGFYPRLALEGIRKNKRLYLPYAITGSVLIMMHYILGFLERSPAVEQMKGGSVLQSVLPLGCIVIAAFSLLFLFYTNSFLMKQRYKEFGLYNILGMDKRNICIIMLFEALFVWIVVILSGLALGLALSKAAELVLINIVKLKLNMSFNIGMAALFKTVRTYAGVYLVLFINSVLRVAFSKPLELFSSSRVGEKVPKRSFLTAILGIASLAAAYYLSLSIKEPLTALVWFFAAVLLVIIGTYLLFIAGSVVFCRMLQKNKKYYYKPNHFVSVSSMVYRMKRNGAGLASICVLLTVVLVMISSTACLYFGAEDVIAARCPNDINISLSFSQV